MNSFMEKLEGILNKYLMPVADNLNKNKIMTAIKDGMMCSLNVVNLRKYRKFNKKHLTIGKKMQLRYRY